MTPPPVDWTAILNQSAHLGLTAFLFVFSARMVGRALRMASGRG